MVQSLMYCAEQIIVPDKLPDILKTYVKAAIRTEPYDLLRWTAAYFRCMSMNVPPPVKIRLEKTDECRVLTKEYLKVLIHQVSKGYYIERELLLARWEGLCLPETELLKLLSLARMLYWPQVHWLKLFAVMVGTLNQDFRSTILMICELLTDEPEGGPNPIPMWMFRECYVFLAELDCSGFQDFVDGRRMINGVLEEERPMPDPPRFMSSSSFQNIVLDEFKRQASQLTIMDSSVGNLEEGKEDKIESENSNETISDFKFTGDYSNPYEAIKNAPDFDSIILLLNEAKGKPLHRYTGPHNITSNDLKQSLDREKKIENELNEREKEKERLVKLRFDHERVEMLQKIGPPWTWMEQFTSYNSRDRSYNFLEELTIPSDLTLPATSEDSFDYKNERYKRQARSDTISKVSSDEQIRQMLLKDEPPIIPTDEQIIIDQINEIIDQLKLSDSIEKCIPSDPSSVTSFLEGKNSNRMDLVLSISSIQSVLEIAKKEGILFSNIDELHRYLKENIVQIQRRCKKEKRVVPSSDLSFRSGKSQDSFDLSECSDPLKIQNIQRGQIPTPSLPVCPVDEDQIDDVDNGPTVPILYPKTGRLEDTYVDDNIDLDEKLMSKEIPKEMILGLVDRPPSTVSSETTMYTESELDDTTGPETRSSDKFSDDSSKRNITSGQDMPPKKEKRAATKNKSIQPERIPFECSILPIPGIGPVISPKTVQDFLTYLKQRSRDEDGWKMVYPRHFNEKTCPNMCDC